MGIVFLSPEYRERVLGEWYDRADNLQRLASQITPQQAGNLNAWATTYGGYTHPDVIAAMGLSGVPANTPAADAVAAMSFEQITRDNPLRALSGQRVSPRTVEGLIRQAETPVEPDAVPIGELGLLGQIGRAFGNTVKALSRGAFLGLSAPFEEVSAGITSFAEAALDDEPGFFSDGWKNFTDRAAPSGLRLAIGELANRISEDGFQPDDLWRDSTEFIGSGFLPGGQIQETRERQKHNLYLPSQAGVNPEDRYLTPGRALLGLTRLDHVVEPGTGGYNLLSGVADLTANLTLDPLNYVLPAVGAGGRAAGTVEDLPTVERSVASMRGMLFRGPRQTVDAQGAAYMLRGGSPAVNRTVHWLTQETSPSRILGELERRGARIPISLADRLASARTPEVVADALINGPDGMLASVYGLPTISRYTNWRMGRLPHAENARGLAEAGPDFAQAERQANVFDRLGSRVARAFERVPRGTNVDADNPEEAVRNFRAVLRAFPARAFTEERTDELVDKMIRVDWTDGRAQGKVDEVLHEAVADLQRTAKDWLGEDDPRLIDAMFSTFNEYRNSANRFYNTMGPDARPMPQLGTYAIDNEGHRILLKPDNFALALDGTLTPVPTAVLETDMHRFGTFFPDPEQLRRTMSRYSRIIKGANIKDGALLKTFAERLIMPMWVGSQITRPATALRAVGDSLIRLALMGSHMTPGHPIEYFTTLLGRKERGITGLTLEAYDEYVDEVAGGLRALADGGGRAVPTEVLGEGWDRFYSSDPRWLQFHAQRLGHMAQDRLMRQTAALPHEEAVDWFMGPSGRHYLRSLPRRIRDTLNTRDDYSRFVAGHRANIERHTGGNPDLIASLARGEVAGVDVLADRFGWVEKATGALANYRKFMPDVAVGLRDTTKDGRLDKASRAWQRASEALSHLFSATVARTEDVMVRSPRFRELYWENVVKVAPRMTPELRQAALESARKYAGRGGGLLDSRGRNIVSRLEEAFKKPSGVDLDDLDDLDEIASTLARDVIKRELYDHHTRNNTEQALRLLAPFLAPQRDTIQQWLKGFAHNPLKIRRFQQAFEGARHADLDGDGRGFFYKDPDGTEVFAYPSVLAALGVGAGAGIATGAGVAGLTRFFAGRALPGPVGLAVGAAAGIAAGVAANNALDVPGGQVKFEANVGSLNLMGNDLLPGLGPVITLPASFVAQKTPQLKDFWDVILPYGREEIESGVLESQLPSYMQRFLTGLQVSEEGQRLFGNTVADVAGTMIASGEWTDPETGLVSSARQPDLLAEASDRARGLFFIRGLAQFVLPAAPRFEFLAEDKNGTLTALESLATVYRDLNDTYGRDEALGQFVALFGADALAAGAGVNSQSVAERSVDPLGADWERQYPDLVAKYRQVIGYLAPHQPEGFDHVAYRDQLRTGDRVAITPQQSLWLHNNLVGSAIVRFQTEQMGPAANRVEGRLFLAQLRQALRENFQGYGSADDLLPGRADPLVQIAELHNAAADPALSASPVRAALRRFLEVWDAADQVAHELGSPAGITSTSSDPRFRQLRDAIRAEAAALVSETPAFSEVWAGVFERALADDEEPPPIPVWGGPPVEVSSG